MIVVFPGQGSQKMHMGRAFSHVQEVSLYVDLAIQITGKNVDFLLNAADADVLNRTENAQIALFTLNYALAQHYIKNGLIISHLAGHSLGEYTALAVAGVLSFEEACMLVNERSRLMQQVDGAMLAVLNISPTQAAMIASLASTPDCPCYVANYNSSTQIVLSSTNEGIERARAILAKLGKKGVVLATSGPFHSPYMYEANLELKKTIKTLHFNEAKIPVISNAFASTATWEDAVSIHMVAPVRWEEVLATFGKEAEILEIGASSVLANMGKRDGYNITYAC